MPVRGALPVLFSSTHGQRYDALNTDGTSVQSLSTRAGGSVVCWTPASDMRRPFTPSAAAANADTPFRRRRSVSGATLVPPPPGRLRPDATPTSAIARPHANDGRDTGLSEYAMLPSPAQYVWELRRVRKLGRGAFGVAWLVEAVSELPQWFPSDVDVGPFENAGVSCVESTTAGFDGARSEKRRPQLALKEVHLGGASPDVRVAAMRELQLLEAVRHPNVVRYVDSGYDAASDTVFLLMEFCDGGDLGSLLAAARREGRRGLPAAQAWDVAMQLLCALQALHDVHGVVHRDIKPGNVLLTAGGGVKVADLGAGAAFTRAGQTARRFVGSLSYVAPEVLGSRPYDAKADMWSLGCVLCEMVTGAQAFSGDGADSDGPAAVAVRLAELEQTRACHDDATFASIDHDSPPIDIKSATANALNSIIRELLQWDDRVRPTAAVLLQEAALTGAHLRALGEDVVVPESHVPAASEPPAIHVIMDLNASSSLEGSSRPDEDGGIESGAISGAGSRTAGISAASPPAAAFLSATSSGWHLPAIHEPVAPCPTRAYALAASEGSPPPTRAASIRCDSPLVPLGAADD